MIPGPIATLFPDEVRKRGEQYVTDGRIRLLKSDANSIQAIAHGTNPYEVMIQASQDDLVLHCACPFAADNGYCKHLWAVMRVADARGLLQPLLDVTHDVYFDAGLYVDDVDDDRGDIMDDLAGEVLDYSTPPPTSTVGPPRQIVRDSADAPAWKRVLDAVAHRAPYEPPPPAPAAWPADRRLVYLVDLAASQQRLEGFVIELGLEKQRADGAWDPPKLFRSGMDVWLANPNPVDRQLAQMLRGAGRSQMWASGPWRDSTTGFIVTPAAFDTTIRLLCETERLLVRRDATEPPAQPLRWDGSESWRFRLRVERIPDGDTLALRGVLARQHEEMALEEPAMLHVSGLMIARGAVARFAHDGNFALVADLRSSGALAIPPDDLPAMLARLFGLPRIPAIDLPSDVSVTTTAPSPMPVLQLSLRDQPWASRYRARLEFDYAGTTVAASRRGEAVFDQAALRVLKRDRAAEARALARLVELGVREEYDFASRGTVMVVPPARSESMIRALAAEGWRVIADGVRYRAATSVRAKVRSTADWFELGGTIAFGDVTATIPAVLDAMKQGGGRSILLADGSRGFIADDLRRRLSGLLAASGLAENGARFRRSQTVLLDALLASLPDVDVDDRFARARDELRAFERIKPAAAPRSFKGKLRPYQRDGLGWLHFLRRFGLGGCLADDMGLGKTIQVLALLDARRLEQGGPSLVVVPRSLVFNWREEAARFAPRLRVLEHTGAQREKRELRLGSVDVVITTYGTMRLDVEQLRETEFDYVVLDEAQAIKNASTASAKAARLLRGHHRLALTGTPIENRLEELWSIFEFLNPGMLGASTAFKRLARGPAAREPGVAASLTATSPGRELLARALRPVILRRTKDQVASELPPKVEQTLLVELEEAQRRVYDQLREQYRQSLLARVDRVGIARSKIQVLEALLRLRQAACHPALIDKRLADAPSAKLDVLLPKLAEASAEGHKALVFSQFTSFLALARERLDAEGIAYEYLDGATSDREAVVARFQGDEGSPVFLISLRAGGQGLNLTAADYVFLLDPWWNPAVEAQAIDRAHRIGQSRHVLATRLVAHDTVEEKILELQQTKRDLADAILNEDQGLLSKIGREELAMLLG